MAYLDDQDKQNQTQGAAGANPSVQPGQQGPQTSNQGGADIGEASTAGVGNGGTGGWTNIQAYINANRDSNSGANALNNTVGKQFDQEQSDMQKSASDAKGQADSQVSGNQIGQDQASQLISQYSNDKTANAGVKDQFNNALNGQYAGPNSWSYGTSAQTQNYGDALNNDQGFQGLMNNLYNTAAGGQINSGELALQQQLDVNNPNVTQTRNDLNSRYKALQDLSGQTNTNTNAAIQGDITQYGQNQKDLRNSLVGQAGDIKGSLDDYYNRQQNPGTPGLRHGPQQVNPQELGGQYSTINEFLGNGAGGYTAPVAAPAPATGHWEDNYVNNPGVDQWMYLTNQPKWVP